MHDLCELLPLAFEEIQAWNHIAALEFLGGWLVELYKTMVLHLPAAKIAQRLGREKHMKMSTSAGLHVPDQHPQVPVDA